jgi:methionyl-tRNA synthetase
MSENQASPELISIEQFGKIDLRVAKVLEAEPVPGTARLLRLRVDIGSEHRQLVAGIAEAYEPQTLVGKSIIVVVNLKPARLRGVESQGMLLAATPAGGKPILATFDTDVDPGAKVR